MSPEQNPQVRRLDSVEDGETLVDPAAQDRETIKSIEAYVHDAEPALDQVEVVGASDTIMLDEAEERISLADMQDRIDAAVGLIATEGIDEYDGKVSSTENPVRRLELDGHGAELDRIVAEYDSLGRTSEAAKLTQIIDSVTYHDGTPIVGEVEYVSKPLDASEPGLESGESHPSLGGLAERLNAVHDRVTSRMLARERSSPYDLIDPEASEINRQINEALETADTSDLGGISEAMKAQYAYERHQNLLFAKEYGEENTSQMQALLRRRAERMIGSLQPQTLGAMLSSSKDSEGGFVRHELREIIAAIDTNQQEYMLQQTVDTITKAYGYESVVDFFAKTSRKEATGSDILDSLRKHEEYMIHAIVERDLGSLEGAELRVAARNTTVEYLTSTGINQGVADKLAYAMRGRIAGRNDQGETDPNVVSTFQLTDELFKISGKLKELGPDALNTLAEKAGIINFSTIPTEQLQTTVGVINGDRDVIARLQGGDSSVIVRDATEDWNGAFRLMAGTLSGGNGANLIFEISSMGDDAAELSRYVALLEEHDIRPSTVTIGGHGSPGAIHIGDGSFTYRPVPRDQARLYGESTPVTKSTTLKRLFARMQPSRNDGTAHIILHSCSQASVETGRKVSTGIRVAREAGKVIEGPVAVYASPVPTNIERTKSGDIRFYDGDAIVFEVDGKKQLRKRTVAAFPLDQAFEATKKTA
jgi:hypothetical protein